MTDPSSETTTESLKAMTGAPDLTEPVISHKTFASSDMRSTRPLWKQPLLKYFFIGGALIPVFGTASFFLLKGHSSSQPKQTASRSNAEVAKSDGVENNERLLQENARLQANAALDRQEYIQEQLSHQPRSQGHRESSRSARVSTSALPKPTPSAPSTISYRSSPPVIQAASRIQPPISPDSVSVNHPDRAVEPLDPIEQWQKLAQLGSYGAIAAPESLPPERAVATVKSVDNLTPADWTEADAPVAQVQTIATASDRSRTAPENTPSENPGISQVIAEANSAIAEPPPAAEAADLNPPILAEAEAPILQAPQPSTQALLAGTSSAGKLTTPIVLENLESKNTFVVELDEPLMDSQGNVALPEGSKLLVQVDRLSENGFVELSATQAIWEVEGLKQQAILPAGVIQIRGKAGKPLVAQQPGGSDRFERDVTQFALGAIRRSAGLYTRSNTRVQTGDRTTVVTENNPEPDILAGALEGGTEAVLGSVGDRSQQAGDGRQRRPEIPYIKAGTPVQVFVNQSMELAM